jgi:hypothetical protein
LEAILCQWGLELAALMLPELPAEVEADAETKANAEADVEVEAEAEAEAEEKTETLALLSVFGVGFILMRKSSVIILTKCQLFYKLSSV